MLLITFLIGLLGCAAFFVFLVAMQPGTFAVTRQIMIDAPPEVIFSHVNDFHKWEAWSPWEKHDPAMKKTFSGSPAGTGAVYEWDGNSKVGKGRITIMDSRPRVVQMKLEFMKPMAAVNASAISFMPRGAQTETMWNMAGTKNFTMKAFCMFADMDKMVGKDFEEGLAKLKAISETPTGVAA